MASPAALIQVAATGDLLGVLKGADGSSTGQNAVMTAPAYLSVAGTTSGTANQAICAQDAGNYRSVSVHITAMATGATVTFQISNDNSTWRSFPLDASDTIYPPAALTTTANGLYSGPLPGRYMRLLVTGITGSATTATCVFSTSTTAPLTTAGTVKIADNGGANLLGVNADGSVISRISDGTTTAGVIAGTTALKTDLSSVAGTATSTGVGASGAGTQRVAALLHDGTNTANVLASATANNNAALTAPGGLQLTASSTSASGGVLIGPQDCLNYSSFSFSVSAVQTGLTSIKLEGSQDGSTNWVACPLDPIFNVYSPSTVAALTATGNWQGAVSFRYLRVNVVGAGMTGTTTATLTLRGAGGPVVNGLSGTVKLVDTAGTNLLAVNSDGSVISRISDGTTTVGVIAGTTALKADIASIAGTATPTGTGAATNAMRVAAIISDGTTVPAVLTGTTKTLATTLHDGTTKVNVIAGTNALKADVSSVAGTATSVNVGTADAGTQRVAALLHDGTNSASIMKADGSDRSAAQNGVIDAPAYYILESATTIGTSAASTARDLGNYRWVSVQFTAMGTGGNVAFQCSNDNSTWVGCSLELSTGQVTAPSIAPTTTGLYHGPVPGRYFRLNNTNTGGTTTVTVIASAAAAPVLSMGVAAAQNGTWTVQPGNTANTTAWLVSERPATAGGLSIQSNTALTNSAVAIKASAGQIYAWDFYNPAAAVTYVQIFNVASGSVTLGTTAPTHVVGVAAGGKATFSSDMGIAYGTAISYAATTTATGSTAPATALAASVFYN